jgi:hypothetical protein
MAPRRQRELQKRRHRRWKLARLRERYRRAQTAEERAEIMTRLQAIAPGVRPDEFLAAVRPAAE